jgi:hypothetical protein
MRVANLTPGDLVLVRVKGRSIYGEVEEITDGIVHFRPLCPAAGWRHANAREVVSHWRKAGRRGAATDEDDVAATVAKEQLSLRMWS